MINKFFFIVGPGLTYTTDSEATYEDYFARLKYMLMLPKGSEEAKFCEAELDKLKPSAEYSTLSKFSNLFDCSFFTLMPDTLLESIGISDVIYYNGNYKTEPKISAYSEHRLNEEALEKIQKEFDLTYNASTLKLLDRIYVVSVGSDFCPVYFDKIKDQNVEVVYVKINYAPFEIEDENARVFSTLEEFYKDLQDKEEIRIL